MQQGRHFYRCVDCLELTVIDGARQYELICDCGGRCDYMGHVHGARLRFDIEQSACDDRCTHAAGPSCDCSCGGVNHGTKRVVQVHLDMGAIPRVTPRADLADRCARVAEFQRAIAEAHQRADTATHGAYSAIRSGKWVADRSAWWNARTMQDAIRKARHYKTHKRRISALNAIGAKQEQTV